MYQIGYAKNEGITATINVAATSMDAVGVPGYVVFWNGSIITALFNKDSFVYANKIS